MAINKELEQILEKVRSKASQIEADAVSLRKLIKSLETSLGRPDYSEIDGIIGTFDGYNMITEEGKRYEVPQNYAAKSKIVYGDKLKLVDEDGKDIFKHIDKVDRKRIHGILTKKEGEWYLLTDSGSYKVSDTAAEFQKAQINSEAVAYIPSAIPDCFFATLDTVQMIGPAITVPNTQQSAPKPAVRKPVSPKRKLPSEDVQKVAPVMPEPAVIPPVKERTSTILDDDDLV